MQALPNAAANSFNAVRLLAAIQVAYIHAVWHLDVGFHPNGWIVQFPGVPVFFAISGYLVLDSLLRLQSIPKFFAHRSTRIYPALLVNIAILETLLYLAGQIDFSRETFDSAVKFFVIYGLTASSDIAASWPASGGVHTFNGFFQYYPSGVLWTLTVELTFYAIMPLFLFFRARMTQTVLIVAGSILSLAYQKYLGKQIAAPEHSPLNVTIIPYFWMFGVGMLFRLWPPPAWSGKYGIPALFATVLLIAFCRGPKWFEYRIDPSAIEIVQAVIVCSLGTWVGFSPLLKSKVLARTDMSYGTYLYHMLFVTALMNVQPEHRTMWLVPLVICGGMAAGALSWHLIERPCMKFARRKNTLETSRAADLEGAADIGFIDHGGSRL